MSTPRPHPTSRSARCLSALALALLCTGMAQAQQTAAPASERQVQGTTSNTVIRDARRIEHITVEDTGARVDEMRYGGVTQSISVQPKNAMPAYEVQPTDERRARQGDGSGGSRVWNVMKF